MTRIVVKIGSNVLTAPDGNPDILRIEQLVAELALLHRHPHQLILVSSGAVAFGKAELGDIPGDDDVARRQLFAAVGQAKLMNKYYELFQHHHIHCGQVLTTKENFLSPIHLRNQNACIEAMINAHVIPIVNENDTVAVTELMFTDNDELSGLIAHMLHADELFILTNVDGLFDRDPTLPGAQLIPLVHPGDDLAGAIAPATSPLGRGGMAAKYHIAQRTAHSGIDVTIANGLRPGILTALAAHQYHLPCTRFRKALPHDTD
jgi:glutamate 5-kinase